MAKGMQLVAFRLGREIFGVQIEYIREIMRYPEITEVPDAPEFLEGVINLRGKVVPVIDLRKRLRTGASERTKATRVLVSELGGSSVGLTVDAVAEVIRIDPASVEEPPEMVAAVGVEYITGVAKVEEKLVILVDIKKVLDAGDMRKMAGLLRERDALAVEA